MAVLTEEHLLLARSLGACLSGIREYEPGTEVSCVRNVDLDWVEAQLGDFAAEVTQPLCHEGEPVFFGRVPLGVSGYGNGNGNGYGYGFVSGYGYGDIYNGADGFDDSEGFGDGNGYGHSFGDGAGGGWNDADGCGEDGGYQWHYDTGESAHLI